MGRDASPRRTYSVQAFSALAAAPSLREMARTAGVGYASLWRHVRAQAPMTLKIARRLAAAYPQISVAKTLGIRCP